MSNYDRYVGQIFDNRYRIIKVIGIGGMAVVFEAEDFLMRRRVAVKMLKDEINNEESSVKRFINESKAVSMLSHPNIVNIYDVSVKDNLKYIVMELVEGITLKNYIQKRGVLDLGELIGITEQILLALHHAHSKNIIHRDIKPQNIMLLKNGVVKVADFGIAKLPNAETVTMTDKAIGTVFYISPEQASGKPIDSRSDLYSLGVTMYEMATGKLPFVAESPVSVALMQVKNLPKPPHALNARIPIGLEQIILCTMEKNPANRFQSASQMLRHLQQIKQNPRTVFKMPQHQQSVQANGGNGGQSLPGNVKKLNPRRQSSRSMFPVIGGVASAFLIVCIISAVVLITKLSNVVSTDYSKQITIPRFVDTWYSEELEAQLESTGYYNVEVEYVFDSERERNVIIGQEPLPDEKRKVIAGEQMCDLVLKVCWGAETCELPEYAYKDKREVKNELTNTFGLKVSEVEEADDYIPAGHVIRTEPAAGTVLKVGESVTLVVSGGQTIDEVPVPNYKGMTEGEVRSALKNDGFELGRVTREYSESVEAGCVISHTPNYIEGKETKVHKGTKFNLVISLGAKAPETEPAKNEDGGEETDDPRDVNDIW